MWLAAVLSCQWRNRIKSRDKNTFNQEKIRLSWVAKGTRPLNYYMIDPSSDSVLKINVCRGEKGVFRFFWLNYCVFDFTIFRRLLHVVCAIIMMFSLRLNFEIFNFLKCSNEKLLWIVYQIEQNDHFQPHIGTKQSIFHKTNNIRQIWINQISLYSESIVIKS